MKKGFAALIIALLFQHYGFTQSDSLNIYWKPNTEPTILKYILQRSVENSASFTTLMEVFHPDTQAVDKDLQLGKMYYYRLIAVDSLGIQSDYSDTVNAALPKITNTNFSFPGGVTSGLSVSDIVQDPDNSPGELNLTFSNLSNVQVSRSGNALQITPDPISFVGSASFQLRVEDLIGFWDQKNLLITFTSQSQFTLDIPDLEFLEDASVQIDLDTTYQDPDTAPDQMVWNFAPTQNLNVSFDSNTRVLTVSSKVANWFGSEDMIVSAQNSNGVIRSDTVRVTAIPVNDPPQLSVSTIYLNTQVSPWIIDLWDYVVDVDDPVSSLNFQFLNFQNFQFNFLSPDTPRVEIVAIGNPSAETGQLRVTDPQNASDQKPLTIQIITENTPPIIVNLNKIVTAEDSSVILNLNQFVVDSSNNAQDMRWEIESNNYVTAVYKQTDQTVRITPQKDWFGITTILFRVIDPLDEWDEKIIPVEVESRIDIRDFEASMSLADQATLSWKTDMPAICFFEYWLNLFDKQSMVTSAFPQTLHSVQLTDFSPDSAYSFRITAQDTSGKLTVLVDSVFVLRDMMQVNSQLIVFPNPVKIAAGASQVYVENLPAQARQFLLFNVLGEEVSRADFNGARMQRAQVDLSSLAGTALGSGYYIYMIRDENNRILKKGKLVVIR